ncbi:Cof-type HAD-IIB family hydrolase [Psychromonas antarctica]|jgi:Cof subfamily protein (haloacid dehalogenase superfamily)|uniref:Cof-type HAD-IIB family hydrolase n=1 Tax=Psychromonas antarctica TaxID=67573 RepID=UPI001EE91CE7|nr:Cof-type HAD-IIB family hydrolase [Psychromonas antarctica]MCG6201206.1 Cof-type HAD-IIB family hydrolase [Psychromonas antarctica]
MYKLIAIDMDGTLLNKNKQITSRTYSAIQDAKAAGIKIVLASGRPLEGLQPYLEYLGLIAEDDFVISYNGSRIQRVGNGKVLHEATLHGSDAKILHKIATEFNVFIHAFSITDGLIAHKNNPWTDIESTVNGVPVCEMDFQQLDDNNALIKIMLVGEPEALDKVVVNLPASLKDNYTVLRSEPFFLEFLHIDSNKGTAVEHLANIMCLDAAQVMCIGDAGNDHHMLSFAGFAVAMGNATLETKALADYIAPSNDQDGVAVAIEVYALQK